MSHSQGKCGCWDGAEHPSLNADWIKRAGGALPKQGPFVRLHDLHSVCGVIILHDIS